MKKMIGKNRGVMRTHLKALKATGSQYLEQGQNHPLKNITPISFAIT
jgi:hypothetical protein